MANAAVVTKSEMVTFLGYTGMDLTEDDIDDSLMSIVRATIARDVLLHSSPVFTAIEDLPDIAAEGGLVWAASFFYLLELLGMRGQIQFTAGDLFSVETGNVKTQYQRWQPMFFFATGMSDSFYRLLPHDTWRMLAMHSMRAWKVWYFKKVKKEVPYGTRATTVDISGSTTYSADNDYGF